MRVSFPTRNYTSNHGHSTLGVPTPLRAAGRLFVTEYVTNSRTGPSSAPAAPAADRKYLLERVDDAAVVQLYADGFSALPLKQKTLIWHLYQAALAGRDIFIDQKHKDALAMRGVFEQSSRNRTGVDAGDARPQSSATPSCSG